MDRLLRNSCASPLFDALFSEVPFLRRYARALAGDQAFGDVLVERLLETLIDGDPILDASMTPRMAVYWLFQGIWRDHIIAEPRPSDAALGRQLMLLTTIEEFPLEDAVRIMGLPSDRVAPIRRVADDTLSSVRKAKVMIIEDETVIAMDLRMIVENLGLEVTGIATTRAKAVKLAAKTAPDVILADIQLADGSSGIDAVADITAQRPLPVVYITAYPERLLTGERIEPVFMITKPYRDEHVYAAISQLLFHFPTRAAA